ncbi:hypothetical protein ABZZ37_27545 [Streptomyces sp. NPDC006464]|uniref:hypothetical protein n=1 Tax=unclassified Streptomyces TaxID=2593676 RepID=UPI0033B8D8D8
MGRERGTAVGFTTTADSFRQADAATHPLDPPFAPQPPPQVISAPPGYTAPPPFGVRDGNAVDEFADIFDGGDDAITDHASGDWHGAMLQFVSSVWGTAAWGKNTAGCAT